MSLREIYSNTGEMIETPCDLCGSGENSPVFEKEGFCHVRCNRCGLIYVSPRLKAHRQFQRISGTGSMGEAQISSAQVVRICRELSIFGNYRRLNTILEIGAGAGWFLNIARQTGWKTWAVEINRDAIANLLEKGVRNIITSSAEDFETDKESFDAVRIWDVIEHLESPRQCLKRVYDALRPGGLLRLSTTNFNSLSRMVNGPEWVYINGSDHIILFGPETIMNMLKTAGFQGCSIKTRSFNLRRKLYHPQVDVSPRWHPLAPFRKLIDETVRLTSFGHQMIVEAIKKP